MRLIAAFLLASTLGVPSAIAQERSDVLLRAIQDACFPRRGDLTAQRQKIIEAGFAQVPVETIPGLHAVTKMLDRAAEILGGPDIARRHMPVFEVYRGKRDGFDLVAVLRVTVGCYFKDTDCAVHDFGATSPVSKEKVTAWIGRPPDRGVGAWESRIATLPGGYDKLWVSYGHPHPKRLVFVPGAILTARATSPVTPCK